VERQFLTDERRTSNAQRPTSNEEQKLNTRREGENPEKQWMSDQVRHDGVGTFYRHFDIAPFGDKTTL
jgi:hypothetical protein